MANFKDYDALTEQKEEFVRHIGGKDITFRKTLPARTVLDLRRDALKTGEDDEEAGIEFLLSMGEKAMGQEVFEHCMDHMGLQDILEVCTDLMAYYGITDSSEGETPKDATAELEANAEAKESPSTQSSSTGEPSTLTSSAFGLIPGGLSTPTDSPGDVSSAG